MFPTQQSIKGTSSMGDDQSMFDDVRDAEAQAFYDECRADQERQDWLDAELTYQNYASIKDSVWEAYESIKINLKTRSEELEFLHTSKYTNLLAVSCLLTMENLSRELVSLPILKAILSSNPTKLHNSDYLIKVLVEKLSANKIVYDVFKTCDGHEDTEERILKDIGEAKANLGVDGLIVRKPGSGPIKLKNWIDPMQNFRNSLMHGSSVATKGQADFVFAYFIGWLRLIQHILAKYEISIQSDLSIFDF